MKSTITYLLTAVIVFSIIFELFARESGIAGVTGSPNETTCNTAYCHNAYSLNSGGGSISITSNIPATGYTLSANYTVNVTVRLSGSSLFGLGFEALNSSNTDAGTLSITNSTTTQILTASNGRKNVTHKFTGGQGTDSMVFSFGWQAPSTNVGTVTFYAAGNAANSNGSPSGDYIYSTSKTIPVANKITTGNIAGNPFCAGKTGIVIPFTKTGTFISGNVFTAQLSNANGLFTSPLDIGTLTSVNGGNIITNVALPQTAGTKYRIRVVSSNPAVTGSINGSDLTISLDPSSANAGQDQTLCSTATVLDGNTPSIGTGTWTVLSGTANIASPNDPATAVSGLGNGDNTLIWTITNGGCNAKKDTVIITSVANPTVANAGPDKIACSPSTTLDGNIPQSGNGVWTLHSGTANISDPADANSDVTSLGSGNNIFVWTISNAPCNSSSDTVIITHSGTITTADAGADQDLCTKNTQLAGNTPSVGTGYWTIVSGSGSIQDTLDPASAITQLGTGQNIFRWSIANPPCTPSTDDVMISVYEDPSAANAGNDQTVCVDFTNFSAQIPQTGTGSWSLLNGTGNITDPGSAVSPVSGLSNGSNTFIWTVSSGPCSASKDTVEIFRTGTISVANAGADQNICLKTTSLAGNTPVTGTGLWTLISGSGNITDPSNPATTVQDLGAGINVFRWTISSAPCTPTTDEVSITNCNSHTISTGNISGSPFCESTSYSVIIPFTHSGTFTENFVAELSDNTGSFSNPVAIGSASQSPISGTIPAISAAGHKYLIRVTNAVINGDAGPDTLSVNTCSTGIEEKESSFTLNVYPNPNSGNFNIQFGNNMSGDVTVMIYNMMGERIFSEDLSNVRENDLKEIRLPGEFKGIVFLMLQSESSFVSRRLLIE